MRDTLQIVGPVSMKLEMVRSNRKCMIFIGVNDEVFDDGVDEEGQDNYSFSGI